jgi:hypothetical protein
MQPTFGQLIEDQGRLTCKEFEQALKPMKTGEDKAGVVILDDARKTRKGV